MVTGRVPFEGETPAVIFDGILNHDPAPVIDRAPDAPARLQDVISKALEKDRDLRFQSAAEIRAELKRISAMRARGRLPRVRVRPPRRHRRRPVSSRPSVRNSGVVTPATDEGAPRAVVVGTGGDAGTAGSGRLLGLPAIRRGCESPART
jgi:serine/threonine protein kinase